MKNRFQITNKSIFQIFTLVIVALTVFSYFLGSAGEDISNTRAGYLSGNGNDLLGAFSALFYGSLPNFIIHWWQYLILIQAMFAGIGLYLIFHSVSFTEKYIYFIFLLFFEYLCINLSLTQSRDGIMLSSIFLSIGIIINYSDKLLGIVCSFILFFFAFSFRPWLTIAIFPIFYYGFKVKFTLKPFINIITCLLIIMVPAIIEVGSRVSTGAKQSFPQQTVMIHDLATTLCLSPIPSTRINAYKALEKLESYEDSIRYLCNSYKPNTWQSSVTASTVDDPLRSNSTPPLKTIQDGDRLSYSVLEKDWLKTIISDPKTYIQNHFYFFTQVLISGESAKIELISKTTDLYKNRSLENFIEAFNAVYQTPWKLITAMHLISPLFIYLLLLIFYIRKILIFLSPVSHLLFLVLTIWVLITTLGFVSDNGRYTYLPILLILTNWVWTINYRSKEIKI